MMSVNNSESCTVVQRCSGLPEAPGCWGGGQWEGLGSSETPTRIFRSRAGAIFSAQFLVASLGMSFRQSPDIKYSELSGCLPFQHANSNLEGESKLSVEQTKLSRGV